jgi:cell cycle checkpoint protein
MEIDITTETVTLALSCNPPSLEIISSSIAGDCTIKYMGDGNIVEVFECAESVVNSYKLSHIQKTFKALQISSKTSIRVNQDGILAMQFMISKTASHDSSFIEAFVNWC